MIANKSIYKTKVEMNNLNISLQRMMKKDQGLKVFLTKVCYL